MVRIRRPPGRRRERQVVEAPLAATVVARIARVGVAHNLLLAIESHSQLETETEAPPADDGAAAGGTKNSFSPTTCYS